MKTLSLLIFCFLLVHCGTEEEAPEGAQKAKKKARQTAAKAEGQNPGAEAGSKGEKKASGAKTGAALGEEEAADDSPSDPLPLPPSFHSYDLKILDSRFKGVYTALMNTQFMWWAWWTDHTKVKILVNHSAHDQDKKLIIRVEFMEGAGGLSDREDNTGYVCTLFSDVKVRISRRAQEITTQLKSSSKDHIGRLNDMKKVTQPKVLERAGKVPVNLKKVEELGAPKSKKFIITSNMDISKPNKMTQLKEQAPPFEEIYESCQFKD